MIVSNVKAEMGKKEISIRGLARETGLSSLTIERARGPLISRCTLQTLEKIAIALECSIKDLFGDGKAAAL